MSAIHGVVAVGANGEQSGTEIKSNERTGIIVGKIRLSNRNKRPLQNGHGYLYCPRP